MEMKWIPVTEKLPKANGINSEGEKGLSDFVWACHEYADGFTWQSVDKYVASGTWLSEVPFDDPNERSRVTAWMPLPEPYKEVQADG